MDESIIAVSGGFDPIHIGHVRMINEASQYGNVVVLLNSDEWLTRKKGQPFMNWEERKEILMAMKNVHDVIPVIDEDDTCCATLAQLKPTFFANGGDRGRDNVPEFELCEEEGIGLLFNIGRGGKVQSSSELVKKSKAFQCQDNI